MPRVSQQASNEALHASSEEIADLKERVVKLEELVSDLKDLIRDHKHEVVIGDTKAGHSYHVAESIGDTEEKAIEAERLKFKRS